MHSGRKLTTDDVRAIKARYTACPACGRHESYATIAKDYPVSHVTIHKIIHGTIYKEIPGHEKTSQAPRAPIAAPQALYQSRPSTLR